MSVPSKVYAVGSNPSFEISSGFIEATKASDTYTEINAIPSGFETVLYTGNGATQTINMSKITDGVDFVWVKNRDYATWHSLWDSVRGTGKMLYSNATNAEDSITNGVTAFNPSSFDLGSHNTPNQSGYNYVAWCASLPNYNANNTDGTIASVTKSNEFMSVVSYTGLGANHTVGHGLNKAPELLLVKNRTTAQSWFVQNIPVGADQIMFLDDPADSRASTSFQGTLPTSSVFYVDGNTGTGSADDFVAYAFTSIAGKCKVGSYIGTGAAGNAVDCGFEPEWVIIKRTDSTGGWIIVDAPRVQNYLYANQSIAENANVGITFGSLDFVVDNTGTELNASGGTYIFLAIAKDTTTPSFLNTTRTHNDVTDLTGSRTLQTKVAFEADKAKLTELTATVQKIG